MMSWNYRVIQKEFDEGEFGYEIHEVYYDKDMNITAMSEHPIAPFGNDLDELNSDVTKMLRALSKNYLVEKELKEKWIQNKIKRNLG